MRILLDTHILLWWLADDQRLPGPIRAAVADGGNSVYVSAISVAEIAITGHSESCNRQGISPRQSSGPDCLTSPSPPNKRTTSARFRGTIAIPSIAC